MTQTTDALAGRESDFARDLVRWQKACGRHGLPWMVRDPYRRWLSEIMLQQTQVSVVLEYFTRFVERFASVTDLAQADDTEVMALWAGLGYYTRARNLLAAARCVAARPGAAFPTSAKELQALPGVGPSTAAAIASFCFDEPAAVTDGNVMRVLSRVVNYREPIDGTAGKKELTALARRLVSRTKPGVYNQAMMDVGAMICTRTQPKCAVCPLQGYCQAAALGCAHELPVKRAKRAKTIRELPLAWIEKDGRVCVVLRSSGDIWPGLWCLPTLEAPTGEVIGRIQHQLTHRDLRITICRSHAAEPEGAQWIGREDLERFALPAPLRKALLTLLD